ncbi:MAG: lysophospholipid acyltransferase family protein [Actinomycetota bacterium]
MESTYLLAKAVLRPWLAAWFDWTFEGLENIPRKGPALVAFNHIAYLDAFAAAYAVDKTRRRPRFLAKSELFQDKRIAWVLKGAKQIEVRRGTKDAPMALDHALRALDRGEVIVVFPEGTVTTDPELNPMEAKTGLARLALASGAPVVPGAIWGTQNIWPKGYAKNWRPGQDVLVRMGEPFHAVGDPSSIEDWRTAGKEIMGRIAVLVASLRPAVPDLRRPKRTAA